MVQEVYNIWVISAMDQLWLGTVVCIWLVSHCTMCQKLLNGIRKWWVHKTWRHSLKGNWCSSPGTFVKAWLPWWSFAFSCALLPCVAVCHDIVTRIMLITAPHPELPEPWVTLWALWQKSFILRHFYIASDDIWCSIYPDVHFTMREWRQLENVTIQLDEDESRLIVEKVSF